MDKKTLNINPSLKGFTRGCAAYNFSKGIGFNRYLPNDLLKILFISDTCIKLAYFIGSISHFSPNANIYRNLLVINILLMLFPVIALAFEDDYIWQEIYSQTLPKAESGDAKEQYKLALMFEKGNGVKKSVAKAFRWYEKSAEQGHDKAIFKVGLSYLQGNGVKKSYQKALKWFKTAGNKGNVRAFYYLGSMFAKGQGVEKNLNQSLEWYIKADKGDYPLANERIKLIVSALKKEKQPRAPNYRKNIQKRQETKSRIPIKKKKPKINTVKSILLTGEWVRRNRPALFLPSKSTKCKEIGKNIECLTNKIIRNIGVADIRYTTKAVLHGIDESGSFNVTYRNNVLEFNINEKDYLSSGAKIPVKLGWQAKEHNLSCSLDSTKHLICKESQHAQYEFVRK